MTRVPQCIVSLSPSGRLTIELPGVQATRRKIELKPGEAEGTLRRVLEGQQSNMTDIGLDGAPTARQVNHWESHGIWADEKCSFCIAEGRIRASRRQAKKLLVKRDGVEVRVIPAKQKGQRVIVSSKSAEELDL